MMPLKSHSNENSSPAANTQGDEPNQKRMRGTNNCHQCRRNDKGRVVCCSKCAKNFCIGCINKWYPGMEENDVSNACPTCRDICNCAACLHTVVADQDLRISKLATSDRIQYSKYIIRVLLPSLKRVVDEQEMEREEESRIQDLSIEGLRLPRASINGEDQEIWCNNCRTSVLDFHRGCTKCSYKLCVTCCPEIRDAFHKITYGRTMAEFIATNSATSKWLLIEDDTIICPPGYAGGCRDGELELKSIYPDNWVSELVERAESLVDGLEPGEGSLSCLRCSQASELDRSNPSRAASAAVTVEKGDQKHFQWHLRNGDPVVVPKVVSGTSGLSWEPFVMWRACRRCRTDRILDFSVVNCLNWCTETIKMHQFFKGYVDGFDSEGQTQILKLETWPPNESLRERLPRHFLELHRRLPFKLYTSLVPGYLNMASKLPEMKLEAELGPKMCFAYGAEEGLGFNSVSNLQYALTDRVNVLVNASGNWAQGVEGGAVWDVFRRQDIPKLEDYLRKHCQEFEHVSPLDKIVHPIHEKSFYLKTEHKRNLKDELGIEPLNFVQTLGDAVFIPAGCPYQIKYLKSCTSAVVNFISPESVSECIRLSAEKRSLDDNDSIKEDKLQVKKMTLLAIKQAVEYLEANTPSTSRARVITSSSTSRA